MYRVGAVAPSPWRPPPCDRARIPVQIDLTGRLERSSANEVEVWEVVDTMVGFLKFVAVIGSLLSVIQFI